MKRTKELEFPTLFKQSIHYFYMFFISFLTIFSSKYSKDLFDRFKVDINYEEEDYWTDIIKRENLKESIEELKVAIRESIEGFEHTMKVAKDLSKKGYITSIMSNHSVEWFEAISDKLGFKEFILEKHTIVSAKVGHAKPRKEIMDSLMQCFLPLNIKPQEIVYFDDKQKNVDSANEYGLCAYKFNSSKKSEEYMWNILSKHSIE